MKNLKLTAVLPALLAVQSVFAQTALHLTLSNDHPAAGEKISMAYDPTGTVVGGKTDITASVYFLDNKKFPVADVDLKSNGKMLNGDFVVPKETKAFFVRISSGADVDNNSDKGYVYLIYKDNKPVEGAYAMDATLFLPTIENYYAKLKKDNAEGARLFNREFELYPNGDKDYVYSYYTIIARLPDYKDAATKEANELEKSADEKDLGLASTILHELKNKQAADSLDAVIKSKFPNGKLVQNQLGTAFYSEKDLVKKDSLYQVYVARYPEDKKDKNSIQDNFRIQLAAAYLEKGDVASYEKYAAQIKNKGNLQGELNNTAYEWAKKGEHLEDAKKLSKESLDIVSDEINKPEPEPFASPLQVKKNAEYTYDLDADTYAFILAKENKFAEALKYEQPVIDHSKSVDPDEYANYINILSANGMDAKAQQAAETAVKAGQGVAAIKEVLKKAYIKAHGNDMGYDAYIAGLEKASKDKAMSDLAKTMINQPAPAFTLKDLDGNTITLADLKGKIVILDFWATWCGPCKASFPGMQIAVDKYKNDPNVKFLFVDSWERDENYPGEVKKFIADNKYTFHVLFDDKNSEGRQGKIAGIYGANSIPSKFFIDQNGNIRFNYIGYSGSTDKVVEEVTDMIEMTEHPPVVNTTPTTSDAKTGTDK